MAWSYGEGGEADADADAEAGDGCHSRQPGDSIAVIGVYIKHSGGFPKPQFTRSSQKLLFFN